MHWKNKLSLYLIWNRYGALITPLILVAICSAVLYWFISYQADQRIKKQHLLTASTQAVIINIEPLNTVVQDFDGATEITLTHRVQFKYQVNDQTYYATDDVRNLNLIKYLNDSTILIRFSPYEPGKSLIELRK